MGKTSIDQPSLTLPVDSSMIKYAVLTIPKGHWNVWKSIPKKHGEKTEVKIMWGNGRKTYDAYIRLEQKVIGKTEWMRFRWREDLHQHFQNAFCYSCSYDASKKHSKSKNISPRIPELLKITERENALFAFKPLSTHVTELTPIFRQLIKDGYLDRYIEPPSQSQKIFQNSSPWLKKRELKDIWEHRFVIYYLLDSKKKELYIGKATSLTSRVFEGRKEIPDWDYFRYDILRPESRFLIGDIERALIESYNGYLGKSPPVSHEIRLKNKQYASK